MRRIVGAALTGLASRWLERGARKRFQGSIFDRAKGLGPVLERCQGASVLDVGSCDGLVAYELARAGAKLIHGFERDAADVLFAKRLFRDVPADARFVRADLAVSGRELARRHGDQLLERYDVVLFLGVYHHLEKQMEQADLDDLLDALLARAGRLFAVRTARLGALDARVVAAGFAAISDFPAQNTVGPLRIYERTGSPA